VFPAGVTVASTWDASLIYARGNAMGSEAKGVGVNVQLAPVAGKNTGISPMVVMLTSSQELSARFLTVVEIGRDSPRILISRASP
jgi:hypothetical protein